MVFGKPLDFAQGGELFNVPKAERPVGSLKVEARDSRAVERKAQSAEQVSSRSGEHTA
jgi:hypothetical protein